VIAVREHQLLVGSIERQQAREKHHIRHLRRHGSRVLDHRVQDSLDLDTRANQELAGGGRA